MNNITKSFKKKDIEKELRKNFILSCKNDEFLKLCSNIKVDEEILMKYTSKLNETVCELSNCKKCKSLSQCKNNVFGHVYFPNAKDKILNFSYLPCKYYKNENKNISNTKFFDTPLELRNANLINLYDEKERKNIVLYIKDFLKKKAKNEETKGLYLNGSFGSGKSYILSALLNELSLKGYYTVNVYYPKLLQQLKISYSNGEFENIIEELSNCDILLLDDIGAENNTPWARDEVLGTILQSRMDNKLTTFFTSNYTIEELEQHLNYTGKEGNDPIKARRIIERIKNLTIEEKLISKNKRN